MRETPPVAEVSLGSEASLEVPGHTIVRTGWSSVMFLSVLVLQEKRTRSFPIQGLAEHLWVDNAFFCYPRLPLAQVGGLRDLEPEGNGGHEPSPGERQKKLKKNRSTCML